MRDVLGWGRDGVDVSGSVLRVRSGVINVSGGFDMDVSRGCVGGKLKLRGRCRKLM
jgi:hypothetical protein